MLLVVATKSERWRWCR